MASSISTRRILAVQVLIAILAVGGYRLYAKYYDSTPCTMDPPILIEYTATDLPHDRNQGDEESSSRRTHRQHSWPDSCQLYSTEYEEAQTKFRQAVGRYKDKIGNSTDGHGSGDDNDDDNNDNDGSAVECLSLPIVASDGGFLSIDVAIFHGDQPGTVVHSSGLHGVEGYAGSAIQLALLQDGVLPLSKEDVPNRPTIVFLHVLNPVGMTEYRRCNENNVDLNRNCIIDFPTFLQQRDPNVANYQDFVPFLSPTERASGSTGGGDAVVQPTAWYTTVGIWLRLLPVLFRHGYLALKTAMVSGQYHHPEGIFYGGQERQTSIRQLVDFLERRPELFANAPSVVWIDVHTGLGPFGKDSLHCEQSMGTPLSASQLHRDWFPTSHSIVTSFGEAGRADHGGGEGRSSDDDNDAFAGYGLTAGGMTTFLAAAYEENQKARQYDGTVSTTTTKGMAAGLFIVQEFGTLPGILVGRALILDNMLYQNQTNGGGHGRREHGGRTLKDEDSSARPDAFSYRSPWLRDAFYPQSTSWRASVVKRGVALMWQAIDYNEALHGN